MLIACILLIQPATHAAEPLVGRTVAGYIEDLRDQGYDIVYSSSLVPHDMRIRLEPDSGLPRDQLSKILAPLGLALDTDDAGRWLVVRNPKGTIIGQVWNGRDDFAVGGAKIYRGFDTEPILTNDTGLFVLLDVEPGEHYLRAEASGFGDASQSLSISPGDVHEIRLSLTPLALEPLVINPSQYSLLSDTPETRLFLSREQIDRTPHLGDDTYRAVHRLPGIAAGDFATTYHVRGGDDDEVQIVLDGMSLVDPFHLKDLGNAFSIVDSNVVAGMDLITGNFPSVYGERMSGVMDVSSVDPGSEGRNAAGVSFSNAYAYVERANETGNARWLGSLRAGYLDIVLDFVDPDEEISPDYYDLFFKYDHTISNDTRAFFNVLGSYDALDFIDNDRIDDGELGEFFSEYHNFQAWGGIETWLNESTRGRLQFELGTTAGKRFGFVDDPSDQITDFDDDRDLHFVGISANMHREIGYDHNLTAGINARRYSASYNYVSSNVLIPPVFGDQDPGPVIRDIHLDPSGTDLGLFVTDEWQATDKLTLQGGLRWDRQSWTGEDYFSPRINAAWRLGDRTALRAGLGRFYQPQQLYELQVPDGETEFSPAQRSDHTILGFEHLFPSQVLFRVEAYNKDIDRPRPRYEVLYQGVAVPPEHAEDRIAVYPDAAINRGIEFLVSQEANRPLTWWFSFTYAKADDIIDGVRVPRTWDQRRAASAGFNWNLGEWNWNFLGHYHSGWPRTPLEINVELEPDGLVVSADTGPRNSERYDSYTRFDMRVSKTNKLANGEITYFFEIYNILDADNPCCVDFFDLNFTGDTVSTVPFFENWLPRFPSLGFVYEWR